MEYAGPYQALVEAAIKDGALYVYACDGETETILNLAADLDHLGIDDQVVRDVPLFAESELRGCEFSRALDGAPHFGHAQSPRSIAFHGERLFSAEIVCRRTTSFTNGRYLACLSANGGGLGAIVSSGFLVNSNGSICHGLLTSGNPNSQVVLATGPESADPHHYVAVWEGDLKRHSGYQDGELRQTAHLQTEAGVHDLMQPRGIAIGGIQGLGNKNADGVVAFYAIYKEALTAEQIAHHASLLLI